MRVDHDEGVANGVGVLEQLKGAEILFDFGQMRRLLQPDRSLG